MVKDLKGCRSAADPKLCRTDIAAQYKTISDKTTNSKLGGCAGETGCFEQLEVVDGATKALDQYASDKDLGPEEKSIIQDFQESNFHDYVIARNIWLSGFLKEVTPIILSGGAGAVTKAEGTAGKTAAAETELGGGAKATATPRTPLAGPTENWKTFVNAEKQIQLEAGAGQRVDQVINETLSGKKNFTSSMTLTTDEALSAGQKYLGPEYREIGKPGSGVFHSADGTKEFRIDSGSISGAHAPGVPHVHFGVKDPVTGKYISNNHVPYAD
nr:hypothetical protein [Pseudomonas pergaminensis]USW03688.1 hypothetical protein KUA23_13745 [Pseudomonas pergaminensis]